jgi:hypothetical protein
VVGVLPDLASVQTEDAAMDLDARGFVDGLKGCFADLKDPRNENSCAHWLFDIVAIAV